MSMYLSLISAIDSSLGTCETPLILFILGKMYMHYTYVTCPHVQHIIEHSFIKALVLLGLHTRQM